MVLKVLELTPPAQTSLSNLWWLDVEVTQDDQHEPTLTSHDLLSKTIAYAQNSLEDPRTTEDRPCRVIIRVVFSKISGVPARADFLEYRMHGAPNVQSTASYLDAFSTITGAKPVSLSPNGSAADTSKFFEPAIGAIISRPLQIGNLDAFRKKLDDEFVYRLLVPWIIQKPIETSRVFWVQGRADIESSRQFYEAAKKMGITLVVLDQPGHWIEDDSGPYAHYREAFIPISVEGDEGLAQRIVDAVRSYPHKVDGVVTISDVRLPHVARACEILGLPTSPSSAYSLAGDKGATRELENAASGDPEGFVLESAAGLESILAKKCDQLKYPLIVKPCMGWNSDCVIRVQNHEELCVAVNRASARHAQTPGKSTRVVVEPYIDGPEVDVNFVILGGEVLFCDISDDFPSPGDSTMGENTPAANFMETLMDVPSKLPSDEKEMLQRSLEDSIRRLGFHTGIFHCEARVRNSHAEYVVDADDILDLEVPEKGSSSSSCYLHEVNARSPGYINCVAALLAYGVDYYAIRLLMSLGPRENERVRMLARPFLGGKPQYTLGVVVLPPTKAGIMAADDAVKDYLQANSDLQRFVVHYQTLRFKGEYVEGPDSSELLAVGYIIVASRSGRRKVLKLSQRIRESFTYKLNQDSE